MDEKLATPPGKGGVGDVVGLADCGLPHNISTALYAQILTERFGITPTRARLIAGLIWGGGDD